MGSEYEDFINSLPKPDDLLIIDRRPVNTDLPLDTRVNQQRQTTTPTTSPPTSTPTTTGPSESFTGGGGGY